MPQLRDEPSVGVLLFIPYRHIENQILLAMREAGFTITLAQARLAQRINPGGSRLTELAQAAQVTKQTAGYLVDQLERAGYLERTPDPDDARARLIRVTRRAQEAAAVATAEQRRVEAEWLRHLGAERFELLRQSLLSLREITDPFLDS